MPNLSTDPKPPDPNRKPPETNRLPHEGRSQSHRLSVLLLTFFNHGGEGTTTTRHGRYRAGPHGGNIGYYTIIMEDLSINIPIRYDMIIQSTVLTSLRVVTLKYTDIKQLITISLNLNFTTIHHSKRINLNNEERDE